MKRLLFLVASLGMSAAHAAELTTFESGTPAVASEVNANFQALNDEIAANKTAIDNIALTPGPQGATGPQGPQGDTGPQGPAGADGTSADTAAVEANTSNITGLTDRVALLEQFQTDVDNFFDPAPASAPTVIEVNCAVDDLQEELDNPKPGSLTIIYTGPCDGDYVLRRSEVTLQAATFGTDQINGSLNLRGASRTTLLGVTVNSTDKTAINLDDASDATMLFSGAFATSTNSEIEGFRAINVNDSQLAIGFGSIASCNSATNCIGIIAQLGGTIINIGNSDAGGGTTVTATATDTARAIYLFNGNFISLLSNGATNAGTTTFTANGGEDSLAINAIFHSSFGVIEAPGQNVVVNGDIEMWSTAAFFGQMTQDGSQYSTRLSDSSLALINTGLSNEITLYGGGLIVSEDVSQTGGTDLPDVTTNNSNISINRGAVYTGNINANFHSRVTVYEGATLQEVTLDTTSTAQELDTATITTTSAAP